MGCPTPYGQSQNSWIFLSPTRCKGGGHSFCPIHTKFSALNILNAQNCWVIFQKLSIKTSLRHEPSRFNGSWEKFDLLKVIYISEFWTTFLKSPSPEAPQGIFYCISAPPCTKLHGVFDIWPLGWSCHRVSKFNEYTVLAVKTYDKFRKSSNIFHVLPKRS